jgi:hypothetical protein
MERAAFLIEKTNHRITCLLNPEDGGDSFTIERSSGAAREALSSLSRSHLSDNPIVFRSRGDTRLNLKLLFDIDLVGSNIYTLDVRDLTQPIWQLAEYSTARGSKNTLPRVRFIWGRAWNIPVVLESVAERFERFTPGGIPRRSWMSLRLLRVTDEVPATDIPGQYLPGDIPEFARDIQLHSGNFHQEDPSWGIYEVLGGGTGGKSLWQIAAEKYGDPSLWRLIARANEIDNPSQIPAGAILRIPPLGLLRGGR